MWIGLYDKTFFLLYVRKQDQNICITTDFKTLENTTKPLFLKDLRTVWDRFGTCLSCGKVKYDESNTLLVDDSPDKALCNPVSTPTLAIRGICIHFLQSHVFLKP